ncbi:25956_t:CDS:2, partial [Racocetra persica]
MTDINSPVICVICKNEFSKKTSTGTLRKHLDTQHPGWSTIELFALTQNNTVSVQTLTVDQKARFNTLLAEWIVSDTLPFSTVESKALIALLHFLNAALELPSRETIKSIVQNSFISMRSDVQALFGQIFSNISITLDIWTSRANMPFLGVIAHRINSNWNLKKILVNMCMLPHPHTGEDIKTKLESILATFNITTKIICATTDSGSNIISAIRLLNMHLSMQNFHFYSRRCLAHILYLIVMAGMTPIKHQLKKYEIGQSVDEGEVVRKILQDVSTRWNSTYLMLSLIPQEDSDLQVVTQFLQPFYEVTNIFSASVLDPRIKLELMPVNINTPENRDFFNHIFQDYSVPELNANT